MQTRRLSGSIVNASTLASAVASGEHRARAVDYVYGRHLLCCRVAGASPGSTSFTVRGGSRYRRSSLCSLPRRCLTSRPAGPSGPCSGDPENRPTTPRALPVSSQPTIATRPHSLRTLHERVGAGGVEALYDLALHVGLPGRSQHATRAPADANRVNLGRARRLQWRAMTDSPIRSS